MTADAKTPRDVLQDLFDEQDDPEAGASAILAALAAANYHITPAHPTTDARALLLARGYSPAVIDAMTDDLADGGFRIAAVGREDGARVEAAAEAIFDVEEGAVLQWSDLPDVTPLGSMILTGKDRYRRLATAAFAALDAAAVPTPPAMAIYRHRKGGIYDVIGLGRVQTDTPLTDMDEVVVYRAQTDGKMWARSPVEFFDGRFECVRSAADAVADAGREAPASCPNCFDRSDCSSVDICNAVAGTGRPYDDPDTDATDGAHPAWWRGNDRGVDATCDALTKVLDGPVREPSFGGEKVNVLARRLIELRASAGRDGDAVDAKRLDWLLRHIRGNELRRLVGVLACTSDLTAFRAAIDAALTPTTEPGA